MADEVVHPEGEPAPPPGESVHLPGPSYLPVLTAFALTLSLTGIIVSYVLTGLGVVLLVVVLWRWIGETRRDVSELPLEH
jgi:hypothetical protein